jgi:hypothetical protein
MLIWIEKPGLWDYLISLGYYIPIEDGTRRGYWLNGLVPLTQEEEAIVQAIIDGYPPDTLVKIWPSPQTFIDEFTEGERTAIGDLAVTDPLVNGLVTKLLLAPSVTSNNQALLEGRDYLLSLPNPPVTTERWATILGAQ